ncbi:hypothetical protein BDW72DRAFT_173916 [Aspergillus terricola var. indicus]
MSPSSQPLRSEADFAHPVHPFAYVLNVPVITVTVLRMARQKCGSVRTQMQACASKRVLRALRRESRPRHRKHAAQRGLISACCAERPIVVRGLRCGTPVWETRPRCLGLDWL